MRAWPHPVAEVSAAAAHAGLHIDGIGEWVDGGAPAGTEELRLVSYELRSGA